MKASKTILLFSLLVGSTILAGMLPFLPLPEDPGTGVLVFLGRFHPLLLHFPIVLVLLTIAFEGLFIYQYKNGKSTSVSIVIGPLLIISAFSALITLIGGYLLYRSGEYQGQLVQDHLWGGVWLMLAVNGAVFFFWRWRKKESRMNQLSYRFLLITAGALIIYTSHLGGSVTHGQDFLTELMPTLQSVKPAPVEEKNPEDLLIFQDLILPVLEDKCQSCHNQYKVKGGLKMTSYAELQKGGKSEKPLLVASDSSESELYHRITLPEDDEDRMPPKEKPSLIADEIALIEWWIRSGAKQDMVLGPEPPDSISSLMERFLPNLFQHERLKMRQANELDALAEELGSYGKELGLIIEIDPEYPGFFGISMQMPPAKVDNQTVSKLKPYANLFSKLSLPGADINDDALFDIGKMSNLRELYLPKTPIKGDGLVYLKDLNQLESVNLSNSLLSNEGMLNLIGLPEIKTVYVFGVDADTVMLQALRKHLPEMKILEEEGAYY
ncbi:MAG: c-type cytochrome domain-containing protein [Cyclobacteriaceae bacterium]